MINQLKQQSSLIWHLQLTILVSCLIFASSCPYTTYDDALISEAKPIEVKDFKIPLIDDENDSFGLGFWSLSIPQWKPQTFPYLGNLDYKELGYENGQLLFFIEGDVQLKMVCSIFLQWERMKVLYEFQVFTQTNWYYIQYEISPNKFEGEWLFTFITFNVKSSIISVQISNQEKQNFFIPLQQSNLKLIQGGRGLMKIEVEYEPGFFDIYALNLNYFKGRISKLFFTEPFYDKDEIFTFYESYWKIPQKFQGIQTIQFINDLQWFDGQTELKFQFEQVGNKFCLFGWFKYDFSNVIDQADIPVLRISTQKYYGYTWLDGDEILLIIVSANMINNKQTNLRVLRDSHTMPAQNRIYTSGTWARTSYFPYIYGPLSHQSLTEWHFLKYEYKVKSLNDQSLLEILFFNDLGLKQHILTNMQLTNSMYYIRIGADTFFKNQLRGYIFNLQFQYNYEDDKDLYILQTCHYTCLLCDGPLENNCISCNLESNRKYLHDIRKCDCDIGYYDVGLQKCEGFYQYYQSVLTIENQNTIIQQKCQLNYFYFPLQDDSYLCIECPQLISNEYYCLDCILNSEKWYLKPLCTKDYISKGQNIVYQLINRKSIDYDIYFIDSTGTMTFHPGYENFCNLTEENCFLSKFKHLDEDTFVTCKQNYYYENGECIFLSSDCIKISSRGRCEKQIDGMFEKNGFFYECPHPCINCYFNTIMQQIICLDCQKNYIPIDGKCIQCGQFCQICSLYYDDNTLTSYLRCHKCIDDSQYLISFDAINCIKNTIQGCQYAFQADIDDFTLNTIDINFKQRYDIENIVIHCALCNSPQNFYLLKERICFAGLTVNCIFGYAQEKCNIPVTDYFVYQCQNNDYYSPDGINKYQYGIDDKLFCTTYQQCLIFNQIGYEETLQFYDQCSNLVKNCIVCLLGNTNASIIEISYICLKCESGYYSERMSGKCITCPDDLNCQQCYQQQTFSQDYWKINVRAFYRKFIEGNNQHPFAQFGQSENTEDYEVRCSMCKEGYELYQQNCIKLCPQSCLQCIKQNNQNICIKCQQTIYGRQLSLYNNQCIECPSNCALCSQRTDEEINQINPLFSNNKFIQHSNICLKSFQDKEYYYDSYFNSFIDCVKIDQCNKQFIISMNLICSKTQYDNLYSNLQNEMEKIKFIQENIFIDDLISGNSFTQFENNNFYLIANQMQIRTIVLNIISNQSQICIINIDGIIQQQFSQNIFATIDVQFLFQTLEETVFQIEKSLIFKDFSLIELDGLQFQPQQNNLQKQVIFQSIFIQSIILRQIIYKQQDYILDYSQILFENYNKIILINFKVESLLISNINSFLLFGETQQKKNISIINFSIENSYLINSTLIKVQSIEGDYVNLQNIIIYSKFFNSYYFLTESEYNTGTFLINQITLEIKATDSMIFDFLRVKELILSEVTTLNSKFSNSTLLQTNNKVEINHFNIQYSNFNLNSVGITNSNILSKIQLTIEINYFKILENEYDQGANFLKFSRYENNNTSIQINQFLISNNFDNFVSKDFNLQKMDSSLIYIELDNVLIQSLIIIRGVGVSDISIVNIVSLQLINTEIIQGDQYKFLGLHQYADCQQQQIFGRSYPQSIKIQGALNIYIDNLQIIEVYSIDFPIIQYNSIQQIINKQKEQIILNNVVIKDNLLIVFQTITEIAIIMIYSEQESKFEFLNFSCEANILHEYNKNLIKQSALLFRIDGYLGDLNITNSQFNQNTVINSTDSIIYINTNDVLLNNCSFNSNSLLNYSILQKFLLWGYSDQDQPYFEDIQKIFVIKSITGNGLLIAQNFIINNSIISNSLGLNGGGFMLQASKSASIKINQVFFQQISNFFNDEIETGGCLHIDSLSASDLLLSVQNTQVLNIYSRTQGGFILLDSGNNNIIVEIINITAIDIYSQQGSILYVKSSKQSTQQLTISINSIIAMFNFNGILQYYNYYYNAQVSIQEENKLINNMTLFYIENSISIHLEDISITNMVHQSLIQSENSQQFFLQNLRINNCNLSNNLISIKPKNTFEILISLKEVVILNTKIGVNLQYIDYQQPQRFQSFLPFKCLNYLYNKKSPLRLNEKNLNFGQNFGRYLFMKLQNQLDLQSSNLINFSPLNKQVQLIIDNIQIINFVCQSCRKGLLNFEFYGSETLKQQKINNILIENSICGNLGCINLLGYDNQLNRILISDQNKDISKMNFEIVITKYYCLNNFGNFGTCIYINNLQVLIEDSVFSNNSATEKGGAIFVLQKQDLIIIKSQIIMNIAKIGGGIYFDNQNELEYNKLGTVIQNNKAINYGNEISSHPSKLTIAFGDIENYLQTNTLDEDIDSKTDQIQIQSFGKIYESQTSEILLPSGQKISEYQFFDWKKGTYFPFNKKLRLVPFNLYNEIIRNLSNTYCDIKSRLINLTSQTENDGFFFDNYTNIKQIFFDENTQDYNLDNLIIYFDNESSQEIVLQLQFNCSSILIPIFNQMFPYNILGYHRNYLLNFNVRSFACQFGEIKNITDFSCQICDSSQGQFSLKLNQEKCEIKDDTSTISVNSAQLNLRAGYWRPFFHSSIITYCLNLPENCLGGWKEGNDSCVQGHIGALCEQCDIYDTRGAGKFSVSYKYSCGSCLENQRNALIISFVSLWTLVSIVISVYGTLRVFEQKAKIINIKHIGFAVNSKINQSGILIKILTNYFQIISSLSTFQLNFQTEINTALNTFGSPIQTMIYSLDCFLATIFQFQIHYARMIWQLIMPFFYIIVFFLIYFIGIRTKILPYHKSVISTTLIYMYIYLQPSLIGGLVELLSFRDISNYKWILANVSYLYDSIEHIGWMIKFCFPILTILAFVIPLYFFYKLYSQSANLNDRNFRLRWGYLYNEYKTQAYFWDVVKIVKKELMIIFLTYYTENVILKATIVIFILVVYLDFNLNYKPYFLSKLNQLDYKAINVCIKSVILALGVYISKITNTNEIQIVSLLFLFILNVKFVIYLIFRIIQEYLNQKSSYVEDKLDKIRDYLRHKFSTLNKIPFWRKLLINRAKQKAKITQLYKKLRNHLLFQAKEIIQFKHLQSQLIIDNINDMQHVDIVPSSIRSPTLTSDKQCFINYPIRESSNQSKYSVASQVLSKMYIIDKAFRSQNKVDQQLPQNDNCESKTYKISSLSQSAKFFQNEKDQYHEK